MRKSLKAKLGALLVLLAMVVGVVTGNEELLSAVTSMTSTTAETEAVQIVDSEDTIAIDGSYSSPEDVSAYLHQYETLPDNFITKSEAEALGWVSSEGNLWEVANGMSIGGDYFGNYEGLLPDGSDIDWHECDVNYEGGYRGSERVLYSNTGLIYYTDDHYESFTQLY